MFFSRQCWAALGAGVLLAVSPATASMAFANTSADQPAPPVGVPGGGQIGGIGVPGTDGSNPGGSGAGGSRPADPPGGNSPLPGGLGNGQGNNQNPTPGGIGGGDGNPLSGTGLVDGPQQGPVPSGPDQQQPAGDEQPTSHGGPAENDSPASQEAGQQQGDRQGDGPHGGAPQSDVPQSEPREPSAGQSDRPGPGGGADQSESSGDRQGSPEQGSPDGPGQDDSQSKLVTPQSHDQKGRGPLRTGHRTTRHSSESNGSFESNGHQRTHRQERPGMDAPHPSQGSDNGSFSDDPGDPGDPGNPGDFGDDGDGDGPDGGDGLVTPARI